MDEAGRGCLAGAVFAAAVILPPGYSNPLLDDSKKLTPRERALLRPVIERDALCWAVGTASPKEIDSLNILWASVLAMHRALSGLARTPQFLLVDGNRFKPWRGVPFATVVKGDGKYMSIAAASILAKTHRDEYMLQSHERYPQYGWNENMGYPTPYHLSAVARFGPSPLHRLTFRGAGGEKDRALWDDL